LDPETLGAVFPWRALQYFQDQCLPRMAKPTHG
jgi:hypothetical protein